MTTSKEHIENLKVELGEVQSKMHRMESSMVHKLHHLEGTLNSLSDILLTSRESSSHNNHDQEGQVCYNKEDNNGGRQMFSSKMVTLEFLRYFGNDSTKWFKRVAQFFWLHSISRMK